MRRIIWTNLIVALFIPSMVVGQELVTEHVKRSGDTREAATVDDFLWLVGSWGGEALGGYAEETWTRPSGGTMLGMFKLTKDSETVFSELMMIVPDGDSVKMILKHFNADLTGWEEKGDVVAFEFLSREGNIAFFDGLTIEKVDDDRISIYVIMHKDDGSVSELAFRYSAQD